MKNMLLIGAVAASFFTAAAISDASARTVCNSFGQCWHQNLHGGLNDGAVINRGRSASHHRNWRHEYHNRAYEGDHHHSTNYGHHGHHHHR